MGPGSVFPHVRVPVSRRRGLIGPEVGDNRNERKRRPRMGPRGCGISCLRPRSFSQEQRGYLELAKEAFEHGL